MDVLKLDMGFLDAHELARGLILASIVRMARWLNCPSSPRSGNPEAGSIPGQHRVRVHAGLSVLASGRSRDVRAHVDGRRSRVRQAADH
ncbi:MAG: hypothetical protein ACLSVD_10550 [Eggerthellaceae bacterium]